LDYLTTHTSLSPIRRGFAPGFVNYKKGCIRLASDKDYQLLAHGRWFSPGIPASCTTKTGRHDIAEILLKVALIKHQKKSIQNILLKYFNSNKRNTIQFLFSHALILNGGIIKKSRVKHEFLEFWISKRDEFCPRAVYSGGFTMKLMELKPQGPLSWTDL
jgi:hypothetical protein